MSTDKSRWFVVNPGGDWKVHVVPAHLVEPLIADMRARGCTGEIAQRPTEKYSLDRGGMCYADRPLEHFPFAGLYFGVTSEHVAHFLRRLEELEPRSFEWRTYYKLHCHWNCIVLTPTLRTQLIRSLRRRVDRAEARATAFYRHKKPSNVLLAEIAEKTTGAKVPPEAMGPDRQARFRRKAMA